MLKNYLEKKFGEKQLAVFVRLRSWGLKGGLAILDQGVFSGANFLLNILLARWLIPEQYGAYAIGYSALFFFLQFLGAYILEPMAVLGPSNYPANLAGYLASQVRLYLILIGSLGCILAVIVLFFKKFGLNPLISNIFVAISISLTLLLLPWMLRRVFYVLGRLDTALVGSVIYALFMILLVVLVKEWGFLTGISTILILAFSGLFSGMFLLAQLKHANIYKLSLPMTVLFSENWKIGKWLIISSVLVTIANQMQLWITAGFLGLHESGALRALQILIQPMMLTITALTALAIPKLSIEFSTGRFRSFNRKIISLSGLLLFWAIVFEIFLLVFSARIELIVYQGKFSFYASLLPIWGIAPLFLAYSSGIQAGFQSAQKPKALLIASALWAFGSFSLGIPLTLKMGIWGASWSAIIGYLVFVTALTVLYWIWVYRPLVSPKLK